MLHAVAAHVEPPLPAAGLDWAFHKQDIPVDAAGKETEAQENAQRPARRYRARGEGGVSTRLRRRVEEEDNCEAPASLQSGHDQWSRDLRRAEARDPDFVPGDSLSDLASSSS